MEFVHSRTNIYNNNETGRFSLVKLSNSGKLDYVRENDGFQSFQRNRSILLTCDALCNSGGRMDPLSSHPSLLLQSYLTLKRDV